MKPALISISLALVLGAAGYLGGRPLDVADYAVVLVLTSLVVWTYEQYRHGEHPES